MPSRSRAHALRPAPSLCARRRQHGRADHPRPAPVRHPDTDGPTTRPRQSLRMTAAPQAILAPVAPRPALADRTPPDDAPAQSGPEPVPPAGSQPLLPGFAPAPVARPAPPALPDARTALAGYPDIAAEDLCRHAKRLGKSAELLVDSLLMRLGERVFPTDEHEPFDRILWLPERPLRLQIKARHRRVGELWLFNVTRGYQRGPTGTRPYGIDDFDLLALVALPEGVVKFTTGGAPRHRIHQREIAGLRARPRDSLDAALRALGLDAAVPQPAEPDAA